MIRERVEVAPAPRVEHVVVRPFAFRSAAPGRDSLDVLPDPHAVMSTLSFICSFHWPLWRRSLGVFAVLAVGAAGQACAQGLPETLLPGCPSVPRSAEALPLPVGQTAAEALAPLLSAEQDPDYEAYAIALARAEADPGLLSLLTDIARLQRCNPRLQTLLAIDVSGAPSSYFLDYARSAEGNTCAAAYAITTLGVRADTAVRGHVQSLAAEVGPGAWGGCSVDSAVQLYHYGIERQAAVDAMTTDERIEDIVLDVVLASFGAVEPGGPDWTPARAGDDDMAAAWARRRLPSLAAQDSAGVSAAVDAAIDAAVQARTMPPSGDEVEAIQRLDPDYAWEPPTAERVAVWREAARGEARRSGILADIPVPYDASTGGVPACDGFPATSPSAEADPDG